MIAQIQGKLLEATPLRCLVDVGGMGYEIHIPITTAEKLPGIGQIVQLFTVAVYREDSATLYGFANRSDKAFFQLLVEKVSGVGPRIALNLMSRVSVATLQSAIASGDVKLLSGCPGIGKKTAERLIVELSDKLGESQMTSTGVVTTTPVAPADAIWNDAVSALIALGYKPADADKKLTKARETLGEAATTESLIRSALG